ncbi:hypothetical protein HY772_08195 [Candidatus Woesearchaeota archaeon]|nr:hypothetical protein [Candidatus Woesearchaeota archaeon]
MEKKALMILCAILLCFLLIFIILRVFLRSDPSISGSSITGFAVSNTTSETGTVAFIVAGTIIIKLTDANITFGELSIGDNVSSEAINDFFVVRNDGSVDFNVYAYGISSPFMSTLNNASTLPNKYYSVHANSTQSGIANTTYVQVPANISTKVLLVQGLQKDNLVDVAKIGIQIVVPRDEGQGAKTADLVVYVETQ